MRDEPALNFLIGSGSSRTTASPGVNYFGNDFGSGGGGGGGGSGGDGGGGGGACNDEDDDDDTNDCAF